MSDDLLDLDPTPADLVDEVVEDDNEPSDFESDFDYAAVDDRWNDGIPAWSAWA